MSMLVIPHRETLNIKCNNKGQQALLLTFPTESYGKKLSTKMKEKKQCLNYLLWQNLFSFCSILRHKIGFKSVIVPPVGKDPNFVKLYNFKSMFNTINIRLGLGSPYTSINISQVTNRSSVKSGY